MSKKKKIVVLLDQLQSVNGERDVSERPAVQKCVKKRFFFVKEMENSH